MVRGKVHWPVVADLVRPRAKALRTQIDYVTDKVFEHKDFEQIVTIMRTSKIMTRKTRRKIYHRFSLETARLRHASSQV